MFEGDYEVWDAVSGNLMGCYHTREEAEEAVAGPYRGDFLIFEPEEDELAT